MGVTKLVPYPHPVLTRYGCGSGVARCGWVRHRCSLGVAQCIECDSGAFGCSSGVAGCCLGATGCIKFDYLFFFKKKKQFVNNYLDLAYLD